MPVYPSFSRERESRVWLSTGGLSSARFSTGTAALFEGNGPRNFRSARDWCRVRGHAAAAEDSSIRVPCVTKSCDSLFNTIIAPEHRRKYEHVLGRAQEMRRKAGKCSSWWHYCWTRKVCVPHAVELNSFPFIPVLWGGFLQGGCGQQSGRTAALSEGIESR